MSSTGSVEPTLSDNQNEVVSKECGDREELVNERVKRSKLDLPHWFVEQLGANIKWALKINGILTQFTTQYQKVAMVDTKAFGKVLVIDGKLQSAELDEYIYHENLVHHALLRHPNPKKVFIMGGGEGSTAREVLKYHTVEKVIMCDIDQEVVEFCKMHLTKNMDAFTDPRLHIVYNDAKAELEASTEKFDVIIGDLADPIVGGPCNRLYTKSFYQDVVKPKLNDHGIFVTQAGLAGVLSHKEIFSPIFNTLKQVFGHVTAYAAQVPSYADTCGWVLAMDEPIKLNYDQISTRIESRMTGEMYYLDAALLLSAHVLNKTVYKTLLEETRVITDENMMFAYGHGIAEHGAHEPGAFVEGGTHEPGAFVGAGAFAALEAFMMEDDDAALGAFMMEEDDDAALGAFMLDGANAPGGPMEGVTGAFLLDATHAPGALMEGVAHAPGAPMEGGAHAPEAPIEGGVHAPGAFVEGGPSE